MTAPYDQQKALADLLTAAGLKTEPEVPGKFVPPVRYVIAAEPWLDLGQTIGSWRAHFTLVLVTATGTNEKQMNDLGAMVRAAIRALKGTRFSVSSVDQPSDIATGVGTSLGTAVNIATSLSRAEFEEE